MTASMRRAAVLAALLVAVGLGVFFIKTTRLHYPLTPGAATTIWEMEIYLQFDGRDEPARLEIYLPANDVERPFSSEEFYNGPFGLSLAAEAGAYNRKAIWTYRFPSNKKVLRYTARTLGETPATPLPAHFLTSEPAPAPFEADLVRRQAFINWTAKLRRQSADDRSFTDVTLAAIFERAPGQDEFADEVDVQLADLPPALAKLDLARHTLETHGIPARIVNGVYLTETSRRVEIRRWLEYHIDGEGRRYFPGGAPRRFFTLWYGVDDLIADMGVNELEVQIALQSERNAAIDVARGGDGGFTAVSRFFDFSDLPITTQLVYRVLVTIPVGIFILVFLRQFVGLKTLGTFMPVLIGIAFRETALFNGIILFTLLVAVGLAMRFYLERLQLLLVPRLAVVLIFIVVAMAGITIVMAEANQAIGLSISLFPMVILTMTIERMSIVWEEQSSGEAIKQGLGSLAVASAAYLAMTNARVEYLMYHFPELLFVLMGLCVLMGRYTGLRVSELWRFREMAK